MSDKTDTIFQSEKIRRMSLQRDFRPVEIEEGEDGGLQIKFSATDALAFSKLLASEAQHAQPLSDAVVAVACLRRATVGEHLQIITSWMDTEPELATGDPKTANALPATS